MAGVNLSNSSTEFEQNIGGFPYILSFLNYYIPYTAVLAAAVIVGITGNVLIISSILINKELRTNTTCVLIANLAISDLTISLVVNLSTVIGVLVGKQFFDRNMALCVFIGASCSIACITSLYTMGFLAINRYVCVFHFKSFNSAFSMGKTVIYCTLTWIVGIILELPNYFPDAGGFVYDKKSLSCIFDRMKIVYTITFSVGCILMPSILIGYLYLRIFIHAYLSRANICKKKAKHDAIRLAKSLFGSFFVFAICWVPISVVFIYDRDDHLGIPAHTFTNMAAHINSALNPVFYAIFNTQIRHGYLNLLNILTCKKVLSQFSNRITTRRDTKDFNTK